jgi:hypothetical protein
VDPDILVPISFFVTVAFVAVGFPLARAKARAMDRNAQQPKLPPEVGQRLERMEQAIDAIAVEVERISEGQRFTTRLLSERLKDPAALPAAKSTDVA